MTEGRTPRDFESFGIKSSFKNERTQKLEAGEMDALQLYKRIVTLRQSSSSRSELHFDHRHRHFPVDFFDQFEGIVVLFRDEPNVELGFTRFNSIDQTVSIHRET